MKKWLIIATDVVISGVLGVVIWQKLVGKDDLDGFVSANGRIKAMEIDIATKTAGRKEVRQDLWFSRLQRLR
ncbi:MAG: hypothetical protein RBR67_17080 [Desulfobacterium sp.]|jgi:HlyD family secretion protein|nr:hypothetical protein [Desulfobacterium sp.]